MITLQNYTSEEIDLFSVHSIIKSGDFYLHGSSGRLSMIKKENRYIKC